MIDHLLGRPSTRLKRFQVFCVLTFWLWVLVSGSRNGPRRVPLLRWLNRKLRRFTPWQIVVSILTTMYAIRHLDSILGFGAPEPLARMYSRPFYRTTWIVTALDAGFATAMNIRPRWLKDIMSLAFSGYYLIYANEADEKLRKFRAFCTVEMLRETWHKTGNPYVRAVTWFHRASLPVVRQLLLPRPALGAHHKRPTKAWLFYSKSEKQLREEEELILDFCGGGFICMTPMHHEERLRQLAKETERPVLAIDYCKAPEYPYPYAVEECYDVYRSLFESGGKIIGMSGRSGFRLVLSGDSAGGNLATAVMLKVLEYPQPHIRSAYAGAAAGGPGSKPPALSKPVAMLLSYPSLNFGFTSWMTPAQLRVLRQQSEVNLQTLQENSHEQRKGSPLNPSRSLSRSRRQSLNSPIGRPSPVDKKKVDRLKRSDSGDGKERIPFHSLAGYAELHVAERARFAEAEPISLEEQQRDGLYSVGDGLNLIAQNERDAAEIEEEAAREEHEKQQRLLQAAAELADAENKDQKLAPMSTRLTMTSMAGYFQDRILTQSMMRAMAILYIGPRRQPDFEHDYFLSPIVAPARLLAQFPPVLFICGEKDPLCDDTVIMAGKIREAKLARKAELERARAGKSARFGEGLRMSVGVSAGVGGREKERDPIEDESVEDWVQMRIIEGWSHGFLQMSALLPEAKEVISFLSTWLVETFEDYTDRMAEVAERHNLSPPAIMPGSPTMRGSPNSRTVTVATPNGLVETDDVEDDSEALTFTPKSRRSPPMSLDTSSPALNAGGSKASGDTSSPRPEAHVPAQPLAQIQAQPQALAQSSSLSAIITNRPRPSSFSNGTTTTASEDRPRSPVTELAASEQSTGRRRSLDAGRSPAPSSASRNGRGSGNSPRSGSKSGASALDEKYKAMLVRESHLLQRRRDDAVFGLGQSASAVHSDEESDGDGEPENGHGQGQGQGRERGREQEREHQGEEGRGRSIRRAEK